MNGIEFVRVLRDGGGGLMVEIPILVVTGHAETEVVRKAVEAGIHGYLVEPISCQSLESRLNAALKGKAIDPASLKR